MLLAGIDLAWKINKNPTAIAFGRLEGKTLTVTGLEVVRSFNALTDCLLEQPELDGF